MQPCLIGTIFDHFLSTQWAIGWLVLGLLMLSVALWMLIAPRLRINRPLSKCFVLSLWVHILLAVLAGTVEIVVPVFRDLGAEEPVELTLVDSPPSEPQGLTLPGQLLGDVLPIVPARQSAAVIPPALPGEVAPQLAAHRLLPQVSSQIVPGLLSPTLAALPTGDPAFPPDLGPQDPMPERETHGPDLPTDLSAESPEILSSVEQLAEQPDTTLDESLEHLQEQSPAVLLVPSRSQAELSLVPPATPRDYLSPRSSPRLQEATQETESQSPEWVLGIPLSAVAEGADPLAGPTLREVEANEAADQTPPIVAESLIPELSAESTDSPRRRDPAALPPSSTTSGRENGIAEALDRATKVEEPRPILPAKIGRSVDSKRSDPVPYWSHRNPGDSWEVPAPYRLRVAPNRQVHARAMGATPATDLAVERGLQWLARNQDADGRWNPIRHGAGVERFVKGRDRQGAGKDADTGLTGLALLAFLGAGYTHQEGQYQETVRRGLEFLIRSQGSDGSLAGNAQYFSAMYCHAMALLALSEAYALTGSSELREPIARGVTFTVRAQDPHGGGWRYRPGDPGDTSLLGWQILALKSAEYGGLVIPRPVYDRAKVFLGAVSIGPSGGLASYRVGEAPSPAMTAEALACRVFLGEVPSEEALEEAVRYILRDLPGTGPPNFYFWYYATVALAQIGGPAWQMWNRALRDTLVAAQRRDRPWDGSWDPVCIWGGYGGRIYSTALAILCLETYYRYLPLLQDRTFDHPPSQLAVHPENAAQAAPCP